MMDRMAIIGEDFSEPEPAALSPQREDTGEGVTLSGRPSMRGKLPDADDLDRLAIDFSSRQARTIETLRRALAWHGDLQRMATTREDWQQEVDAAIVWVKNNPEPGYLSFPTIPASYPAPTEVVKRVLPTREEAARAIEIAIVEKTMHHPVAKFLIGLKWLWPHVADAVLGLTEARAALSDGGDHAR